MIRETLLNQKKDAKILELVYSVDWSVIKADLKNTHCLYDEEINKIEELVNEK